MTRQDAAVAASAVVFMWAVIITAVLLQVSPFISAPAFIAALILGKWLSSLVAIWFFLGEAAVVLSDEAAAKLSDGDNTEVQLANVIFRKTVPRQAFACAVARRGEPIVMYRGWSLLGSIRMDNPADTKTVSLLCRRYRL